MQEAKKNTAIRYVRNAGGPVLGYSESSGVRILQQDGLAFKDLNKDGKLDPYEDWRLPAEVRAKDLASKMTIEQIAGLMLYSSHQAIPGNMGWFPATYGGGKAFAESGAEPGDLSDQQLAFIKDDHIRHILLTRVQSPETAAVWNNNVQAYAESIGLGIPANNSSDPRHGSDTSKEFNAGAGGTISMWPESMGLAATFDPEVTRQFGDIASKEYRALGLATALSPQVDIATDPRWFRFGMTFGEDPQLAADMARAYVDGFQTSEGEAEISDGWGYGSVNAMVKHWPGGGSGEGGRDAHFGYGKYAVYPGGNFDEHLIPFTEGAFRLSGKTGQASAVMPYYTISVGMDSKNGEDVGNAYNAYLINDLLREKYGYDGVVCTDWGITADEGEDITRLFPGGRCWGVEEGYTVAERHYKLLMAGVDQFGGNNEAGPVIEAYNIGVREHGEPFMRRRFEQSAVRLLKNMFRLGLFENPYLQVVETAAIVGCPAFMEAGYQAQLRSIVLLKNEGVLPLPKKKTVYIPKRSLPADTDWMGMPIPASEEYPVNLDLVRKYFEVTDRPEEADFALLCIESPRSTKGYSKADAETGSSGYVPISLQYGPYTAEHARETSLAGDSRDVLNRSYKGKTVTVSNAGDLEAVIDTKKRMGGKPVIVSILLSNPAVIAEFEREADAIVAHFGVQDQAVLDILSGAFEPQALLPFQMPAHMKTVEEQFEDVPHDMEVYVDSAGRAYDFAYGLNWSGVITDARTEKYGNRR
ncbi:glycoside hydrolase family 3 protein [Paenibacillus alkaliterrae]|uniref:glycoside hydrolase family 3 protein n=1 Tax=Paenibacillus alkaliterrae TaxID=320909 RepID=UPI001F453DB1|nr:glycoside hydrolase family 3 N-terminal domain-containing protein [Paenibacillus alkaliterrae]MCF2939992.1 glycoside hydrolase family 3 protein [Paenibacillus alkaliterrae]